ncbi:IS3-Spn1%2C transposase [Streptococcus pneumoniae]|nr:IS3-Spn1%2C transposase [Streptococcus pneumoniae]
MTEFAIPASTQKLYLPPVLDGFNSEIIAFNLSCSPNLEQVQTMLEQAFTEKHYENTILHSDQGWQYQHDSYHQFLEGKGIQASMSRKGNSPDNGMMESFFGILKSEMFYGYEKTKGRVPESGECHPKKVKRTPIEGGKRERRKTEIVQELMTEFSLVLLLKSIKLARWTYYYHLKQLDKTDKDQELKAEIQSIFIEHKGNYAYRRVHLELRNRAYLVNHKRVQGLIKVLNLQAKMRQKRKYSSHKGDVGKKAENLIQGQFEGSKTMEKCYTDVTEFAIPASTQKLYLSPVLDGFNSEIIAFNLSTSPNLEQVKSMLEQAFTEKYYENTILHSDQGWQYRHDSYHRFLESKGVQASMSRKGNSQDNGMMESFFGILKSEMFYGYEKTFKSLNQLEQAIVDYIDYYNNKRIKVKLKGLSLVQYRTKSFG